MTVNTIVFGPTGGVASYAVRYALTHGANITLAMRDPSKTISALSASESSSDRLHRVKADLTQPESVLSAASEVKAHSAFVYNVPGPQGTPRASIQALKDAGVKHVVMLSSYSVSERARDTDKADLIGWAHASLEIAIEEIFGVGNFTALRPMWFASNSFRFVPKIKQEGVIRQAYTDNVADFVTPRDIGEVAGAMLLRTDSLPQALDMTGQQVVGQCDAVVKFGKAGGYDVKVEEIGHEDFVQDMIKDGMPEPLARYLANMQQKMQEPNGNPFQGERFDKGQKTVKEVLGREGMTLDHWIEENKGVFSA